MYDFYKYNILPEERFKKATNVSLYIMCFIELVKKSFLFENDRLYIILRITIAKDMMIDHLKTSKKLN